MVVLVALLRNIGFVKKVAENVWAVRVACHCIRLTGCSNVALGTVQNIRLAMPSLEDVMRFAKYLPQLQPGFTKKVLYDHIEYDHELTVLQVQEPQVGTSPPILICFLYRPPSSIQLKLV